MNSHLKFEVWHFSVHNYIIDIKSKRFKESISNIRFVWEFQNGNYHFLATFKQLLMKNLKKSPFAMKSLVIILSAYNIWISIDLYILLNKSIKVNFMDKSFG